MNGAAKYVLFFVGLAAVIYGCWLIFRPLGWILGGVLLIGFALIVDKQAENRHGSR